MNKDIKENATMIKPQKLKKGDKVAIVSLSSGILGDSKCAHQLEIGIGRLLEMGLKPVIMHNALSGNFKHEIDPGLRAEDLKHAFYDSSIKAIICAIGGDDTYKVVLELAKDFDFMDKVIRHPKIFVGFSDTTNNHIFFYKLGLVTYYGVNFLSDLAELDRHMLPYTYESYRRFFTNKKKTEIKSSPIWYDERTDYSDDATGTPRISHEETRGYEVLYGKGKVTGKLLGGCLESLYDGYTGSRYPNQKLFYEAYEIMPTIDDWKDKIMFIETSEETPAPELFKTYLDELESRGILGVIKAIIVGKPMNETHYEAYKEILIDLGNRLNLPILYNMNFGHATPRTILPYGLDATINFDLKTFTIDEAMFSEVKK